MVELNQQKYTKMSKKIILDTQAGIFYEGAKDAANSINMPVRKLWRRLCAVLQLLEQGSLVYSLV